MQDPASCSGWSLRLIQLLKTKLLPHLTPHMAFPRGEDFKNTAITTFRTPSTDALKNSSACSSSLLLRGCSFNFVNMLFPACFNCSQKCYYVPYSLLSISNIFLWNQILILHCAGFFFYVKWGGFRGSGAPSSADSAERSRYLVFPPSHSCFRGLFFFLCPYWPPATHFGSYSQQFRCCGALS